MGIPRKLAMGENRNFTDFERFRTVLTRFWRPGGPGHFLDAIRFFSNVYEPVETLKTSNRVNFHVLFIPIARPFSETIHF